MKAKRRCAEDDRDAKRTKVVEQNGEEVFVPRSSARALTDALAERLGSLVGGSRVEAAAAFGEAVRRAFADEDAPVVGADLQSRAEAAFEAWLGRAPAVAWDAHRRVHEAEHYIELILDALALDSDLE